MITKKCCKCKIFGDDFQRANADDPGNYTELGGSDYDVDSNELLCVVGGLLICDTAHPGGASAPARVRRRFKRTSTSQHARVVLGEQDASNYLYASVETISGCDVLRLFRVVAGVATELGTAQTIGDGAPLDTWHTLEACLKINPGYYSAGGADVFRAKVTLSSGKVYGTQAPPADFTVGDKAGLDDSAGVRCDDFYFGWMQDETAGACRASCPDCKTPCLIETDSFPGGSETACKWSSGKLRVFHPELGTKHYAKATFDLQSGENAEVRVNMKADGSEYHWAKLALSGSTLTLTVGKNGSTLATETGTGAAGEHTLTACWDGSFVTGSGGGLSDVASSTTVADGIYAGRSGTAEFRYFEFQKHFASGENSGCPNCPEPGTVDCACCAVRPPRALTIDLGAGGLTNSFCDACEGFAGEFGLLDTGVCKWVYCSGPHCSDVGFCNIGANFFGIAARMVEVTPDTCRWEVSIKYAPQSVCDDFVAATSGCILTANYESAPFSKLADCSTVNVSLSKVNEFLGEGCNTDLCPGGDTLCNGALPSTLSLYGTAA